jgi:hypothetical protein
MNGDAGETIGWPEFARTVARVYRQVDGPRVIFTSNYGEAGAVDRYGPDLAYSGHNAFAEWGPPPDRRGAVVVVGLGRGELAAHFRGCRLAARVGDASIASACCGCEPNGSLGVARSTTGLQPLAFDQRSQGTSDPTLQREIPGPLVKSSKFEQLSRLCSLPVEVVAPVGNGRSGKLVREISRQGKHGCGAHGSGKRRSTST